MKWSRGYIPHIDGDGLVQHVVIRTHDSLPADLFRRDWPDDEQRFNAMAAALDDGLGACALHDAATAKIVHDVICACEGYALKAFVVMPNHAHALIAPVRGVKLGDIVRRWKGPAARRINMLTGKGGRLWARDYFDRYMRDHRHFNATVTYIEANPVSAGLCGAPREWLWSSAYRA